MTGKKWRTTTDATILWKSLKDPRWNRKRALFAVASVRRGVRDFADRVKDPEKLFPLCLQGLELAERLADGEAASAEDDLLSAKLRLFVNRIAWGGWVHESACQRVEQLLTGAPLQELPWCGIQDVKTKTWQVALIRDIFGDPFPRILTDTRIDPGWLSSTVLDLARTIYLEKGFEQMPILADALLDAGCDNADLLAHCQGPGPHAKGCWVMDSILGKA